MALVRLRITPKVRGLRLWVDGTEVDFETVVGSIQTQRLMNIIEIEWEAEVKVAGRYVESKRNS